MLTTLSRWRNPTSPPTSTSWASCWTSRGRWDSVAPVITGSRRSSSTSPPPPTRTSTRWTPYNPRERPHIPPRWSVCFPLAVFSWQHQLGCFLCMWPHVSKWHQLSVLDKVTTCGIGYCKGRDFLHPRWRNSTCCIDTGLLRTHVYILPMQGLECEDFQVNRVGPNGRIGVCVP